MRTEITKLHQRLGTTFIYVTHDQVEAMTMGTRIVVMKDGFIQQVDSPNNLYRYPANLFVAGFIGSPQMNFIDAKILKEGNDFFVEFGSEDTEERAGVKNKIKLPESKNIDGKLEEYVGKDVVMGIRPEDVHSEDENLVKYADGVVEATLDVSELMGAETYLYLDCEGSPITARVDPDYTYKNGEKMKIAFETGKIHLFDKETELAITKG